MMLMMVLIIVLASLGSRTSEKGRRVKQDLRAFLQFLKNDDTSTYPDLIKNDPQYFEKVYPYAVAFNLDKTFTKGSGRTRPWPRCGMVITVDIIRMATIRWRTLALILVPEISSAFTTIASPSGSGEVASAGGSSGGGFWRRWG